MSNSHELAPTTADAEAPWGPFRSELADGVTSCVEHLGRLELSLAPGSGSDRSNFARRAAALSAAARDLVRLIDNIEGRLLTCREPVTAHSELGVGNASCMLPRGHYGGHHDAPPPSLANQVRDSARVLVDSAEDLASWVHLLGLTSDRRRALGIEHPFDPEGWETFADLEDMGRYLRMEANEVGDLVVELVYAPPVDIDEEWDDPEAPQTLARGLDR